MQVSRILSKSYIICINGADYHSIERTKHLAFSQILSLLHEQRGSMLLQISRTVSERIYDVLLGRPEAPIFVFEGDGHELLEEAPYDSPALVRRCKLQNVQGRET
jgi:hypothetical protein